jgi:hypothetical protein
MPLTIAERKHLMPFGAQLDVARAEKVSKSYVSAVMGDAVRPKTLRARKRLRRVQVALARKLGRTVDDVFPPQDSPDATTIAA